MLNRKIFILEGILKSPFQHFIIWVWPMMGAFAINIVPSGSGGKMFCGELEEKCAKGDSSDTARWCIDGDLTASEVCEECISKLQGVVGNTKKVRRQI